MANEQCMMLPVLPGKRTALQQFAAELAGPRRAEFAASQAGVLKESWFVQSSPQGDLLLVHFEAPDPLLILTDLAASSEPFEVWFRAQVQEITGVNLTQPSGPLPERIFDWKRD